MKIRKITAICVLAAMLVCLTACGSQELPAAENTGAETEGTSEVTEAEQKAEQGQEMQTESGTQTAPDQTEVAQGPVSVTIYDSNDDATALIQETVEIDALTPENLAAALTERGILKEDIRVLSVEQSEKDGQKVLDIDFSQEFGSHVRNMGTAGETMIMGSVTNTFLSAYGCEKAKITVEGQTFSTGHKEYTGYSGYYE